MIEAQLEALTVKQYAELKGVHPQTVYTAIRNGRLLHPIDRITRGGRISILVPIAEVSRESITTRKNTHER